MAAVLKASVRTTVPSRARADAGGPYDPVERLTALHLEAEETALLANLLGRTLLLGITLGLAAFAALAFSDAAMPKLISWGLLMAIGTVALVWAYVRTIRAPFEREALEAFGSDLSAVLFYAGFAWGAGAF